MIESMAESVVPNWAAIRLNRLTYIPDHTCVKGPRQDSSAFLRKIYLNDNYQLCYTFFTNIFLKKHKQSSKKGQIKCECTSLYRQNAAITLLWNHLVLTQLEITCYYQCSDLLIRVLQQCKKLKKKKKSRLSALSHFYKTVWYNKSKDNPIKHLQLLQHLFRGWLTGLSVVSVHPCTVRS